MKPMVDPRRTYQDNAVLGASPIELVVILYDLAIEDMRRAVAAMKNGEVEVRSAGVGHALMVLTGAPRLSSSNSSTTSSGRSFWRRR